MSYTKFFKLEERKVFLLKILISYHSTGCESLFFFPVFILLCLEYIIESESNVALCPQFLRNSICYY